MHHDLIEAAKKYLHLLNVVEHVYVFGSALDLNKIPSDIDLLIIYSEYTNILQRQAKEFAEKLETESGLPVDLTILCSEEEKEVCFLERVKSLQLK